MALQKDWTLSNHGILVTNAYIKIVDVNISKRRGLTVHVGIAKNKPTADDNHMIESMRYYYPWDEDMDVNPLAYGYAKLKLETEFSDAVDF